MVRSSSTFATPRCSKVHRRVSNVVANDGESSPLGIWSLEPDVLVGGVELRSLESDEVNLSYLVFPGQRRRGFALRAAQLALEYARTSLSAQAVVIKMLAGTKPRATSLSPLGLTTSAMHRLTAAPRSTSLS